MCLAVFNFVFTPWSFWGYELESDAENHTQQDTVGSSAEVERKWRSFKSVLSDKPTVLGACFVFAYQGAEVAISGWVISFLVQFRHGNPDKVGFVTSGFWAGITLGKSFYLFGQHGR